MTKTPHAAGSGQFLVGGDIAVHRPGSGSMRIAGKGIWGDPATLTAFAPPCVNCPNSA